jgi:hypothetical protein
MNVVNVTFPSTGGTYVNNEDPELVMQGRYVYWHFHPENPDVRKVRITFQNPTAAFFPNKPSERHWCERNLVDGNIIWGKAPAYFPSTGPLGSRLDKYTIQAFDANGIEVLPALDPAIRTDGP